MSAVPARRAARLRPGEGLLADRSFGLFWLARTVSLTGSAVTAVVLPLLMYQQTGSPVATSLLAGTEAIPYIVFGPFAGVISDRVRRRPYLVGFDLASAAAVAVIPVSWASPLRAERRAAPARPCQPAAVRNVTVPPHHGPEGGTATVDDGGKAE